MIDIEIPTCKFVEQAAISTGKKNYLPEDFLINEIVIGDQYKTTWASSVEMFWECVDIDPLGKAVLCSTATRKLNPNNVDIKFLRATIAAASRKRNIRLGVTQSVSREEEKSQTDSIMDQIKETSGPAPLEELNLFTMSKRKYWTEEETKQLTAIAKLRFDLGGKSIASLYHNNFPRKTIDSIASKVYMIRKGTKQAIIISSVETKPYVKNPFIKEDNVIDESPHFDGYVPVMGHAPWPNEPGLDEPELKESSIEEDAPVKATHDPVEVSNETVIFKDVIINSEYGPITVNIKVTGVFKIEIIK